MNLSPIYIRVDPRSVRATREGNCVHSARENLASFVAAIARLTERAHVSERVPEEKKKRPLDYKQIN